jgi:hypothetical protein
MLQSVDNAFDSILDKIYVKINEQAEFQSGQFQIGCELFFMNRLNFFDGFQFNDYHIFYNQIRPKAEIQFNIFVEHRNPDFLFAL